MLKQGTPNKQVGLGGQSAGSTSGGGAAAVMAVDLTRAIRPPRQYSSKIDGDFKIWVRHLEHYFSLLNIVDARKTTVLLYYLGDEASNTAYHLKITDATDYEEARDSLMQYFSPVETPEELRTNFHQRFQLPDETLEHFAMELRVLCSKAYKTMHADELEDMAKQQFILGVRSNLMRERLIVKRPKNLREAIEYARLLEVANKTVRGSASSNIKNVFATMSIFDSENNIEEETNNDLIEFNSDYARTQYESITCWSCGEKGHKRFNCPNIRNNEEIIFASSEQQ